MTLTEQVFAQAALLAGELDGRQTNLLRLLCGASASSLTARLREGLTPEGLQGGFHRRGQSAGAGAYSLDGMEYYPVEIQFRTISMDFWAAMEHRICYKSQPFDELEMKSAFRQYAEILDGIEKSFEVYSENCG